MPEVTAEYKLTRIAAVSKPQLDNTRAENMPRIAKSSTDCRRRIKFMVITLRARN